MKFGEIITWILIVFMVANMLVSTLALARYDERAHQKPAANAIEQTLSLIHISRRSGIPDNLLTEPWNPV